MTEKDPRTVLEELFHTQRFAVLATEQAGEPYANLVAFAVTPDLKGVLFATPRGTRKHSNLLSNPRVALLIDSRSNRAADCHEAVAVTVLGQAEELAGLDHPAFLRVYLERHPDLQEFAQAPTTSMFRVSVERYVLVDHFQHVVELIADGRVVVLRGGTASESAKAPISAFDGIRDACGCIASGISDLATNPEHMKGFSRD